MDRNYWDIISRNYQAKILSVFDNDIQGIVREEVACAGIEFPEGVAADLGCGVGRFTPWLTECFEEVEACDFTEVGLEKARQRCGGLSNVRFHQVDLTTDPIPFEPVDFALCVNVLIMPSLDKRMRAWRAVVNQVKRGGKLLLVAPSLESAQMEHYSKVERLLSDGVSCGDAQRRVSREKATAADLRMGIHRLDGVRTKHYVGEELKVMFEERSFVDLEMKKLVYPDDEDEYGIATWDWVLSGRRG